MANSFPLLLLFFFYYSLCLSAKLSHAQSPAESFILPVEKDLPTMQYLATLSYGTPLVPTKLVLDLGGPFLWLHCASRTVPSSSALTTPHRSIQCLTAKTHQVGTSNSFISSPADQDQYQPCQVFPQNTITGAIATEGELVEDLMALQSSSSFEDFSETIHHPVRFTCSPTPLLDGLASGAKGMLGLGRSRTSLTSQVFDSFSTHRKLTLCLSSSNGVVLFGTMAFESPPVAETLRSLTFTPLLTSQNQINPSNEYFINVSSIKINGKRLSLELDAAASSSESQDQEGSGGFQTQLSSIVPYTTLQSSIYSVFKTAFEDAAASMNMTRVASVAPFEVCYSSRGIGGSRVGPNVPIIELVMQSEMVKWSVYGRNSMVRVSKEVMCLGFMDGGLNLRNPIVIGAYQLEDVIVQFDLSTSMVGFSSSLLTKNTHCSAFNFGSMPAQSASV